MKKKILVIDDDNLVLKSMVKLLVSQSYDAVGFRKSDEAIQAFKAGKFDLVVTDIRMPEKDGLNILKEIREFEKKMNLSQVPCVMVTGYASEDAPLTAMEWGAAGYILKPFDYEYFIGTVKKVLEMPQYAMNEINLRALYQKIKFLIGNFYSENEKEIFLNSKLKVFLSELERYFCLLEKETIKLN